MKLTSAMLSDQRALEKVLQEAGDPIVALVALLLS